MPGKKNPQPQAPSKKRGKNRQSKKKPVHWGSKQKAPSPQYNAARTNVRSRVGQAYGLKTLAAIQALPGEYPNFRIPSQTPLSTSVLKFEDERPFAVTAGKPVYAMVLRTPTRQLWLSRVDDAALAGSSYFGRSFYGTAPIMPNNEGESTMLDTFFTLDEAGIHPLAPGGTGNYMPNYVPAIDDQNRTWFYFPPSGASFSIRFETNVTPTVSTGAWVVTFEQLTNFSTANKSSFTVAAGQVGTTNVIETVFNNSNYTGWLRPTSVSCSSNNGSSAAMAITRIVLGCCTNGTLIVPLAASASPVYTPAVYFDPPADTPSTVASSAPWRDSRVTASSVLFVNETSYLYKEGHVNGVRINNKSVAANVWSTKVFTNYDSIYSTTTSIDKYGGALSKGAYTFSRPDDASLKFRDWSGGAGVGGTTTVTVMRLDAFDYIDILRFNDKNGTSDSTLTAITTFHLEWLNTLTLWPTGVQRLPYEHWRQAIATLSESRNFSENPNHVRAFFAAMGRALKWAAPIVAPYARDAGLAMLRAAL